MMNRRERTCVRFPQDRGKPGHAPAKLAQRERVLSFYKTKAKYPRAQIAPVFPYPAGSYRAFFCSFPKCNRHFDEFVVGEKMAWKMEDFPCLRLAFWRGSDRRNNLSPSALSKNKCNAVFRLVSVPVGRT